MGCSASGVTSVTQAKDASHSKDHTIATATVTVSPRKLENDNSNTNNGRDVYRTDRRSRSPSDNDGGIGVKGVVRPGSVNGNVSSSAWKRTSFDPLDHLPDPHSSAGTLQTPKGTLIAAPPLSSSLRSTATGATATTTSILSNGQNKEGPGSRNPNSPAADTTTSLASPQNTNGMAHGLMTNGGNGNGMSGAGAPIIREQSSALKRQTSKAHDEKDPKRMSGKPGYGSRNYLADRSASKSNLLRSHESSGDEHERPWGAFSARRRSGSVLGTPRMGGDHTHREHGQLSSRARPPTGQQRPPTSDGNGNGNGGNGGPGLDRSHSRFGPRSQRRLSRRNSDPHMRTPMSRASEISSPSFGRFTRFPPSPPMGAPMRSPLVPLPPTPAVTAPPPTPIGTPMPAISLRTPQPMHHHGPAPSPLMGYSPRPYHNQHHHGHDDTEQFADNIPMGSAIQQPPMTASNDYWVQPIPERRPKPEIAGESKRPMAAAATTAAPPAKKAPMRRSNSTSSLYLDSTISFPNDKENIAAISKALASRLVVPNVTTNTEMNEAIHTADGKMKDRYSSDPVHLARFLDHMFVNAEITSDCLIIALVYIDRFLAPGTFVLTSQNVRPVLMIALLVAAKVWDDRGMWNVDCFTMFPDLGPLSLMNSWERIFLYTIDYQLIVGAVLYAQVYFQLRNNWATTQTTRHHPMSISQYQGLLSPVARTNNATNNNNGNNNNNNGGQQRPSPLGRAASLRGPTSTATNQTRAADSLLVLS